MTPKSNCSSCSKESYKTVPVARVLDKLDDLFSKNDLAAAERLLEYWDREAKIISDDRGLLEILNEEIGYYRRTNNKEKGLAAVNEAFDIINKLELATGVSSATVYLNGATTMKAFGLAREAMPYYEKAKNIYEQNLDPTDYKLAAFHNNVSSAYKDLGEFKNAEESCIKAISILEQKQGFLGEIAVSLINLAHIYHDADPFDERIGNLMDKAWDCLMSEENQHNGDFAFICSKCYPSFAYFGYFEREADLKALTENIYGRN